MKLTSLLQSSAVRQTLLYGVSIALMKGVSLLMLPFIAHQMTPENFGRLEVIGSLAVIGSIVIGMGLEDALFRFAGTAKDPDHRRSVAANIFGLALLIGCLSGLAGWWLAPSIANWVPGDPTVYEVRLITSMLALEGSIAIPLGWLRMQNQVVPFFLLTTGRALLQALLVLFMLSAGRSVAGVLEAGLIAAALQAMILAVLKVRDTGIHFDRTISYQALVYSLPIVGSGLVAFLLNGLDRWILAFHASLDEVARLGIAVKFSLAVVLLLQPFGMWWSPRRFKVLHGEDGIQKVTRYISLGITLTLIAMVLVGLAAPLIITIAMPETYLECTHYIVIVIMVMGVRELTELVNLGCFIGQTTGSQLAINCIGSAVGVVVMLILTPLFAIWGVITALLAAQIVRLVLFFLISQYRLHLPYPVRPLMVMTVTSLIWIVLGAITHSLALLALMLLVSLLTLPLIAVGLDLIPLPEPIRQRYLTLGNRL